MMILFTHNKFKYNMFNTQKQDKWGVTVHYSEMDE